MSLKTKYILQLIFDYLLTWGGTAGIIVYNYVAENSSKYKITFSGIVLVVVCLFVAKGIFEKTYRNKMDNSLQQLAAATDNDIKETINKDIDTLKTKHDIYTRLTMLMPFAILYVVCYLGEMELKSLRGCCGLILVAMGIGSFFNIEKKKTYAKLTLERATKKTQKRLAKLKEE